ATVENWRNDDQFDYAHMTTLFHTWQQFDPASKRLCMQRMRVLLDRGYSTDAKRVYYDWVQQIKDEYGLKPSAQAIALSNRITRIS
ncbi:MAG: bacterial transcriptional activator domain-containing protein, partial [Mariprofundus sp.]|nr:bacterial transcriptional activator domain-containing protein [Mariprofundus sp.]